MATDLVLKLSALVLGAALGWISFRIFGARVPLRNFATVYSHWFALGLLIFSFLLALDAGGFRVFRPELFVQVQALSSSGQDTRKLQLFLGSEGTYAMKVLLDSDKDWHAVIHTPGFLWIASMGALRAGFALAWLVVAWNAFRRLAGMSWSQTVRPMALFLVISLLAALVAGFFQMAPIMVDTGRWLQKWSY